ncbi:MAG: hypothetical protein LBK47_05075 [Prevotellaceae bacterium]|jgi:hypothetical protein|nr:hypothetical protein [Prevotellaceae bacterium]
MDTFFQIIFALLISGLMVFGAVFFVLRKMLAADANRRNIELLLAAKELTLPLRLQAHERLMLFLERISLEAMVLRLRKPNTTNAELHADLTAAVRSEFEHNLAQQMYISQELWNTICMAKNTTLTVINTNAQQTDPKNSSMQLAQMLIKYHVNNEQPTADAMKLLKKEVAKLF